MAPMLSVSMRLSPDAATFAELSPISSLALGWPPTTRPNPGARAIARFWGGVQGRLVQDSERPASRKRSLRPELDYVPRHEDEEPLRRHGANARARTERRVRSQRRRGRLRHGNPGSGVGR